MATSTPTGRWQGRYWELSHHGISEETCEGSRTGLRLANMTGQMEDLDLDI